MELCKALNEKVMKAIQEALKDVKPRPAVDRLLTARTSGKHAHYCQFLTEYNPNEFGVIYVGLADLTVKIHAPGSKSAKLAARKEIKRRAKAEAKLAEPAIKEELQKRLGGNKSETAKRRKGEKKAAKRGKVAEQVQMPGKTAVAKPVDPLKIATVVAA